MPSATNDRGPSVSAPEPHTPATGDAGSIGGRQRQETLFDLPGIRRPNGAAIAACIVAAHLADESPAKVAYINACARALLSELRAGPCSMARSESVV